MASEQADRQMAQESAKGTGKMTWIDAVMLPLVMMAWLFLSYDAVNRFCRRRGWEMRGGAGIIIWIAVGFSGGAYLMVLFNAL